MRGNVFVFIVLALVIPIAGCTEYKKSGIGGGFTETQLGQNMWKIEARGNAFASRSLVSEIVLLRSADLAIQNGYNFFAFADSQDWEKTGFFVNPSTTTTTYNAVTTPSVGTLSHTSGTARSTTRGGGITTITKPRSARIVVMFKTHPQAKGLIYDARFICRSLGQKLDAKCGEIR